MKVKVTVIRESKDPAAVGRLLRLLNKIGARVRREKGASEMPELGNGWREITDPSPMEYREHKSLGHWENAGGERIEYQRSEHGDCYYRYSVTDPTEGRAYPTLDEAFNGGGRK